MSTSRGSARRPGAPPAGRTTAGPPTPRRTRSSPAVYRRRRIVAALLALLLLGALGVGAIALVSAIQGGEDGSVVAEPTPGPTPTAAPEPSATAGYVPVACTSDALAVTETTADETYPGGAPVTFTLAVSNVGPVPCLVDGGAAALGVVVTSGADRVWASVDCAGEAPQRRLLLDVEASEELTVTWEQDRSAPGCPASEEQAAPGTYRAALTTDGGGSILATWEHTFAIG